MTQLAKGSITSFPMVSWKVPTPNGTMHVHIQEHEGKPVGVIINIGKTGADVSAWADCVSRLITLAIEKGAGINEIIEELSGLSGEKSINMPSGVKIRSGPDGVAFAFLQYRNHKYQEHVQSLEGTGKPRLMVIDNGARLGD